MFLFQNLYLRQLIAIIPAGLIAICCGIQLAYGIFNTTLSQSGWMFDYSLAAIAMVPIAFHIASIFGSFLGCFLYYKTDIFWIHFTSSIFMIIGSILFAIPSNFFYIILTSRILTGFSFGITFNTALIYISEISSPSNRARNLCIFNFNLVLGMFLQTCLQRFQLIAGTISLGLAIASLPIAYYKMPPSYVFLILNSRDSHDSFLYFQNNKMNSSYEDFKVSIMTETTKKLNLKSTQNIRSLGMVLMAAIGYFAVFNAFHNHLRLVFMKSYLMEFTEMSAMGCQLIGSFMIILVIEELHKKWIFSSSAFMGAIILSGFGSILILINFYYFIPAIFFLTFEFFIGFGLNAICHILKAELFTLREKPFFVALSCMIQELLQIAALIVVYSYGLSLGSNPLYWPFLFAPTVFVTGIFIMLYLKDTRMLSLMEVNKLYEK
ncbi:hypothetical protein PVAND_015012 [Polypedilum vanderplanki]|uniref:Uncharacterized protein n=1 Tax=Polypedilum vanderplanki TaxID=319348 RepID=A0A9J6BAV2_POLVA|nr:hypothetical protein PVAND_015012 [Polypedilum vanderplanki]